MVSAYHALAVMASSLPRQFQQPMNPQQAVLLSPSPHQPASPTSTLLNNFQIAQPVLTPSGPGDKCGCVYTSTLMEHDFAFSYGRPFVGAYVPPPCSFNRVNINLTVTSRGRQFDRLGIMYLGDVEVFRTSTAEPTVNGIIWTYMKEMQQYNALWNTENPLIFDLGNLVDDTYTGIFHTILTATFFTVPNPSPTADIILPISAMLGAEGQGSAFSLPDQNASVSHVLPKNVNRAVVTLSACGQSTEEFWYTNTFNSLEDTFAESTGPLYGGGPWREVQLLIDGQLAGVSWPFPVIFTGGIVPGLWRPIVGIDAFDLREHEIDITPWLPLILDDNAHSFEIRVVSLNDDGAGSATPMSMPSSYWIVSGKIFLFLDQIGHVTTGTQPTINTPPPTFTLAQSTTQNSTGANETLAYNITASRNISITSTILTIAGPITVSWSQELTFASQNVLTHQGLSQYTNQSTHGSDHAASGYASTYAYPLIVNSSYAISPKGFGISASLSHGLNLEIYGPSIIPSGIESLNISRDIATVSATSPSRPIINDDSLPIISGALLSTIQNGSAEYFASSNGSYSFGTTEQIFLFEGAEILHPGVNYELYRRHVKAVNATVVKDDQRLARLEIKGKTGLPENSLFNVGGSPIGVRELLGRGPY